MLTATAVAVTLLDPRRLLEDKPDPMSEWMKAIYSPMPSNVPSRSFSIVDLNRAYEAAVAHSPEPNCLMVHRSQWHIAEALGLKRVA